MKLIPEKEKNACALNKPQNSNQHRSALAPRSNLALAYQFQERTVHE
jgi:hypothetical protein